MKLVFTKMQALGNDFVVIDATKSPFKPTAAQVAHIADRHFGVGCDQVLVVDPSPAKGIDFGYRIYNADGSEVGQCGNGARCFAKYVIDNNLTDKHSISVQTISGQMQLLVDQERDAVTVDMGAPQFNPKDIPLNLELADTYTVQVGDSTVEFSAVSMGNPHAVLIVDNVNTAPVESLGPQMEQHPVFTAKANIGFMQILSPTKIALRVYERGAGETLACGSGACAAVVAGIKKGLLNSTVLVTLPGGDLQVTWSGEGQTVMMCGPATTVFKGELLI